MGREPPARIGHVRSRAARVLAITMTMLFAAFAHADKIDDLNNDLDNDSDRVRLTAVLALTNQQSPRSIPGLVKRMLDPGEKKNIRGLAANALGEIVSKGSPNAAQKKAAIDALSRAKNDPEPFVSAKADAALSTAGSAGGGAAVAPGSYQGVYVSVGPFSAKDPAHKAAMKKTAESKLSQLQSSWVQKWAGGAQPTAAQLAQKKFAGFYIDGTLESVTVNKSGGGATVTCKVNAYLAEFPSKNIIAPGTGSANVQGGSSARDIELGTQDCVQAVIESLITKRIVPTIKSKI